MPKRILLVEDGKTEALRTRLVLEENGFQVSMARDGIQGLELAAKENPDLIILDTILPRMSGYEAYHRLLMNPTTAVIPTLLLVTQNGNSPRITEAGNAIYLAKPFSPSELLECVQRAEPVLLEKFTSHDRLLALMSHELCTPLHKILGLIDLVLSSDLTTEQFDYLKLARASAKSLNSMVNDILAFSELESGDLILEEKRFDLWNLISELNVGMVATANEKGLQFACNIAPDVPHIWLGDPLRLSQVMRLLISNGIKFTDEGSVTISVSRDSVEPNSLFFSVSDTGIGIGPDKQAEILRVFCQLDNTDTRQYEGLGVGLPLADHLVRLMDGKLGLESEGVAGLGSTFFCTVRLVRPLEDERDGTVAPTKKVSSLRILVAEDSPTNQLIARVNLTKAGHSVHIVDDGRKAVEAVANDDYDLVLMDISMPEMDGIAATGQIRKVEHETGRHVPIVAMTAFTVTGYKQKCLKAGMDGFVKKPVQAEELKRVIEPFLDHGRQDKVSGPTRSTIKKAESSVDLVQAMDVVAGDSEILQDVVEMFLAEYVEQMDCLKAAVHGHEKKAMEATAHRLAGVVGNVGGVKARKLAKTLEGMAIESELEEAQGVLNTFVTEMECVVAFYKNPRWIVDARELEDLESGI